MSIKIYKNTMKDEVYINCPSCESKLGYTYDDIRREDTFNFIGQKTGVHKYIICPVCKGDIDLTPRAAINLNPMTTTPATVELYKQENGEEAAKDENN